MCGACSEYVPHLILYIYIYIYFFFDKRRMIQRDGRTRDPPYKSKNKQNKKDINKA